MSLSNTRAVQAYIDAQHAAGQLDKDRQLEQATIDTLGLPDGSTVEDMLHAKMDPLVRAILDEIADHARIDAGIEVEDGTSSKIGETRQSGDGVIS